MDLFYTKLKISKEEFLFQYQSHTNYPSALAFCDTLNFLGIKNDVYEINKDRWDELPNQFITFHNNKFTYVEKLDSEYLIYTDKAEKLSKLKLHSEASNFVIIFENGEVAQDKKKVNFNWILYCFFCFVAIYSYFHHPSQLFLFNILSIIGIFISMEIFKNKFGKKSIVINTICNSSKKESEFLGDCDKIFNSDKINFFGLRLSDFSLIYFLGTFFLGLFFNQSESVLKVISYFSILVIAYSLFIQLFIEKIFCKICLTIISVLIAQIIISHLLFNNTFEYFIFFNSVIIFSILILLIIYINSVLTEKEKYYELSLKNIKFKKNYDIFKKELKEKYFEFHNKNDVFWIGKRDAKLNISLVTNPFCGYCKEAHIILEKLINKYPDISVQIRFNYHPELPNDSFTSIMSAFKNIYDSEGSKSFLKAIEIWFLNNNLENFKNEYEKFFNEADLSKIILLANDNKSNGLTFTPVFLINNYQFPDKYDREDIFYFIDELIDDEDIFNEKL